ncbi:piggyBac transposable element-derived protein 3-like [Ixodes scapularis]|uniref:piggyBac transposable element-derived protein 3-like n=1 Tax=Ixodes scapularis TaxID=6945 RepID=UPI001A9DEC52|nr:piggyBac transposable element-derived protein 3-like [Ixodes scapularis]
MADSGGERAGIPTRSFYAKNDITARDILERVVTGEDVSDFSDLSESEDEDRNPPDCAETEDEDWDLPQTAGHEDGNDEEEELEDYCGPSMASTSVPGNKWKKDLLQVPHPDFSRTFSEPNDLESPITLFRKFLANDMLKRLVEHTNLYSTQKYGSSVNTTALELEQYIDTMSRNRFLRLMKCLHVVNNLEVTEEEKKDKLWKLRPWILGLQRNLASIEKEEFNAVDEIMVAFTGRSFLKQYIPNKPTPWGFKLWGRAGTTGILYQFEVYQGQSNQEYRYGLGGDTVLSMCSEVPSDEGFKVAADNFFSSLDLVEELTGRGIQFVGTLRQNRLGDCKLLDEKTLKKLGQCAHDHRMDNAKRLAVVRWFDRKAVTLVSNFVSVEPVGHVKRYDRKAKVHIDVPRPDIVAVYNSFMGGIDQHNYHVSLYKYTIRSRLWYLYIFYHTIYICVVNGWNIHRRQCAQLNTKPMKLRTFIAMLSESLMLSGKAPRGRPACLPSPPAKKRKVTPKELQNDIRKDGVGHLPLVTSNRLRCKNCVPSANRFSSIICAKCEITLCLNKDRNCFYEYHKP